MHRSQQVDRHTSHKNSIPGLRLFTHSLQGITDISNGKQKNKDIVTDKFESPGNRTPTLGTEDKMPRQYSRISSPVLELPPRLRKSSQDYRSSSQRNHDQISSSKKENETSHVNRTVPLQASPGHESSAAPHSADRMGSTNQYRETSSTHNPSHTNYGPPRATDRWGGKKQYRPGVTTCMKRGDHASSSSYVCHPSSMGRHADDGVLSRRGRLGCQNYFKSRDSVSTNIRRGGRISPGAHTYDSVSPTRRRYGPASPSSHSEISSQDRWTGENRCTSLDNRIDSGYCEREDWSDELIDVDVVNAHIPSSEIWEKSYSNSPSPSFQLSEPSQSECDIKACSRNRTFCVDSLEVVNDARSSESVFEKVHIPSLSPQKTSSFSVGNANMNSNISKSEKYFSNNKFYARENWNAPHYKPKVSVIPKNINEVFQSVTPFTEEDWETEIAAAAASSEKEALMFLANNKKLNSECLGQDVPVCVPIEGDYSSSGCNLVNNLNKELIETEILKTSGEQEWVVPMENECIPWNRVSLAESEESQNHNVNSNSSEQHKMKKESMIDSEHSHRKAGEIKLEQALWKCRISDSESTEKVPGDEERELWEKQMDLEKVEYHHDHLAGSVFEKDGEAAHLEKKESSPWQQAEVSDLNLPNHANNPNCESAIYAVNIVGENGHNQILDSSKCGDTETDWLEEKLESMGENHDKFGNIEYVVDSSQVVAGLDDTERNESDGLKSTVYDDSLSVKEFLPIENSSEVGDFHLCNTNRDDSTHWETASENEPVSTSMDVPTRVEMFDAVDDGFHETENTAMPVDKGSCDEQGECYTERIVSTSNVSCSSQRQSATEDLEDVIDNICAMENEQLSQKFSNGEQEFGWSSSVQTCPSFTKNFEIEHSDPGIVIPGTEITERDKKKSELVTDLHFDKDKQTMKIKTLSSGKNDKSQRVKTTEQPWRNNKEDEDIDGLPFHGQEEFGNSRCSFRGLSGKEAYEKTVDRKLSSLLAQRRDSLSPHCRRDVVRKKHSPEIRASSLNQKSGNPFTISSMSEDLKQSASVRKNVCDFQKMNNLARGDNRVPSSEKAATVSSSSMYLRYLDAYGQFKVSNYLQIHKDSVEDWMKLIATDIALEQKAKMFHGLQPTNRKRHSSAGSPGLVSSTLGIPSVGHAKELIEDHNRFSGIGRGLLAPNPMTAIGHRAETDNNHQCQVNNVNITLGDGQNKPLPKLKTNTGFPRTANMNDRLIEIISDLHPTTRLMPLGPNSSDQMEESKYKSMNDRIESPSTSTNSPFFQLKNMSLDGNVGDGDRQRLNSETVEDYPNCWIEGSYQNYGAQGRRKSDTECHRPIATKYVIPQKRNDRNIVNEETKPECVRREFMRKVHERCQTKQIPTSVQAGMYNCHSPETYPGRLWNSEDEDRTLEACNEDVESFLQSDTKTSKQTGLKKVCSGSSKGQMPKKYKLISKDYNEGNTTEKLPNELDSGEHNISCSCASSDVHMWLWRSCTCPAGRQPKLCEVQPLSTLLQSQDEPDVNCLSYPASDHHGVVASHNSMGSDRHSNSTAPPPVKFVKRETLNMSESSIPPHYLVRNSLSFHSLNNQEQLTNGKQLSNYKQCANSSQAESDSIVQKISEDSCDLMLTRQESVSGLGGDHFLPVCQENKGVVKKVVDSRSGLGRNHKPDSAQKKVFAGPLANLKSCFPTLSRQNEQNEKVLGNVEHNTISERRDMLTYLNDLSSTYTEKYLPIDRIMETSHKMNNAAQVSDASNLKNRVIQLSQTLDSLSSVLGQNQNNQQKHDRCKLVGYSSSDEEIPEFSEKLEDRCDNDENHPSISTRSKFTLGSESSLKSSAEKRKFSDMISDNVCSKQRVTSRGEDIPCEKDKSFLTPTSHKLYSWQKKERKQLFRSSSDSSVAHMPQLTRIEGEYVASEYQDHEASDFKMRKPTAAMVNANKAIHSQNKLRQTQREEKPPYLTSRNLDIHKDVQTAKLSKNVNSSDSESLDADFSFASQESIEKPYFFTATSQPLPPSPYFNPKTFWQSFSPSSSPLTTYSSSLLGGGVMSVTTQSPYASLMGALTAPSAQLGISPLLNSMGISRRGGYCHSAGHVTSKMVSPDVSDTRSENSIPVSNWKARMKERANNYGVNFIDSHCHIDFLYRNEAFQGSFTKYMRLNNDTFPYTFEGCVAVFCRPESFQSQGGLWKDLAEEANIWIALGCHPKSATSYTQKSEKELRKCLEHTKVVALGEIGLDYSGTFHQHAQVQKVVFRRQLDIALEMDLPLVIHCRDAEADCLQILEEVVPKSHRIHCHCFTGTFDSAQKWLNLFPNLFIGLTPLVTKKSAWPTKNVAFHIPLNKLLLETDSPYFIPSEIPRGEVKCSHPGFAFVVAEEVAYLKEVPVAQVLKACRENTRIMYGI